MLCLHDLSLRPLLHIYVCVCVCVCNFSAIAEFLPHHFPPSTACAALFFSFPLFPSRSAARRRRPRPSLPPGASSVRSARVPSRGSRTTLVRYHCYCRPSGKWHFFFPGVPFLILFSFIFCDDDVKLILIIFEDFSIIR